MSKAHQVAVIGGSGFSGLLSDFKNKQIYTRYGHPSGPISIGTHQDKTVVFLPRHGVEHDLPPHKVPYRANLAAFRKLGISQVIGPCAAGSLSKNVQPGDFVLADQYLNFTHKRADTYFDGPKVVHLPSVRPYCAHLREIAIEEARKLNINVHETGTVVVIEGPRFSTAAESKFFSQFGEVINMTQYPEVSLAGELDMCYLNISLITDYDAGLEGQEGIKASTYHEMLRVFEENNEKLKELLLNIIPRVPEQRDCECTQRTKGSES